MEKPVAVFDGECGFCRRWITRWQQTTGDRIEYVPYQTDAARFPQIARAEFEQAFHLIEPDGAVCNGAHAVFRTLAIGGGKRWPYRLYRSIPGVAGATEFLYRRVARNRRFFSFLTALLWGASVERSSFQLSRWLFLRLVGVVYLIAFLSLFVQIDGLSGDQGIVPASDYLNSIQRFYEHRGEEVPYWRHPTLGWLASDGRALRWMCWGGMVASVLAILRIVPALSFLILWVIYLSLVQLCQPFMSFQWDMLLLEVGLLSVFLAPWSLLGRLKNERETSPVMRWLCWLALFRLMFCSGVVKLLHDDPGNPAWHQLTALVVHYETQPIPHMLSWYAHQLPVWIQKLSVAIMFVVEIIVPFLIFFPRRLRHLAAYTLMALQLLILLTGNYNFFNLLTIALCIFLFDDRHIRRWLPLPTAATATKRNRLPQRLAIGIFALCALPVGGIWIYEMYVDYPNLPAPFKTALSYAQPFRSVNSYGLFRRMTMTRPEIIVEGSDDGVEWLAYEFKWKPGDTMRRPSWVAPHQPRLDWQMWFAALSSERRTRFGWFPRFLRRLQEGTPEVLALLDTNPFPDQPPRFIRAVCYDYRFTDVETKRATGAWWTRDRYRLYARPRTLPPN